MEEAQFLPDHEGRGFLARKLMKPDSRKCTWSLLSERTETQPDIRFTIKALKWIRAMVEEHSGEVGFLGLVRESDGAYVVDEIFYPKHCLVTSTTCEIAPEGNIEIAQMLIDEGRIDDVARVRMWGHSHHTMGTSPSGQDDSQAIEMMNNSGAYLIRAICSKNGEMSVSFFDKGRDLKFENVKWTVAQDYDEIIGNVISVVNLESNSKEKVQAIRSIVSSSPKFDDDEYKAIAEEVKSLKKKQLPENTQTRGSVHHGKQRGRVENFRNQDGDGFLPYFQRDMFEDWENSGHIFPYGGYRTEPYNNFRSNGKKKVEKLEEPLLTDREIESVVDAAWEGETL